jgi:hypothetical protein
MTNGAAIRRRACVFDGPISMRLALNQSLTNSSHGNIDRFIPT